MPPGSHGFHSALPFTSNLPLIFPNSLKTLASSIPLCRNSCHHPGWFQNLQGWFTPILWPLHSSLQRPLVFSNTYIHGHTLVLVNTSLKCQLFTFWHTFQPLWSLMPSLWSDLFFKLICPPGSLSVFSRLSFHFRSSQSTYSLDDLLSWFLPHGWQHRLLLWFLCTSDFASHLSNPESMLNPPTWLLTPISKFYQRKTTQSYKTISLSIHGLHPGLGLLVVLE